MNILVYLKAGTEHLPELQSFTGNVTSPYERNIFEQVFKQTNKQTNKQTKIICFQTPIEEYLHYHRPSNKKTHFFLYRSKIFINMQSVRRLSSS